MSVLWPSDLAIGFHLTSFFTQSCIVISFIHASVCEKAFISYSCVTGFIQALEISPLSFIIIMLSGMAIIIIIIIITIIIN